jgi:hypothetical protein
MLDLVAEKQCRRLVQTVCIDALFSQKVKVLFMKLSACCQFILAFVLHTCITMCCIINLLVLKDGCGNFSPDAYSLLKQAGESAQSPITAYADEYEDGLAELEAIEAELEALYDSRVCTFLVSLLSSASASTRMLAGATYLLAMMTAGKGSNAEEWRIQVCVRAGCSMHWLHLQCRKRKL